MRASNKSIWFSKENNCLIHFILVFLTELICALLDSSFSLQLLKDVTEDSGTKAQLLKTATAIARLVSKCFKISMVRFEVRFETPDKVPIR